ncbi:hypothetical protein PPS11_19164 [Pseudomonas putida S11]|nr:hypothetical protein PPS11_19164 [Pseudomonas putida S11]
MLSGLPITSALVMTFLCLEQGTAFALGAVPGALGGLAAVQATYTFYLFATRRLGIGWACIAGDAVLWRRGLRVLPTGATCTSSIAVALVLIGVLIRASGREPRPDTLVRPRHRFWEVPLRMVSATSLLMVTTSLANWLGPATSGMLAPIPVIAWPLVVFAHVQTGRAGNGGDGAGQCDRGGGGDCVLSGIGGVCSMPGVSQLASAWQCFVP